MDEHHRDQIGMVRVQHKETAAIGIVRQRNGAGRQLCLEPLFLELGKEFGDPFPLLIGELAVVRLKALARRLLLCF